ncbi:MAG: hypothetical protein H0X35_11520, partial [Pseudonocardiales bacterium]|nr:hypothetical protein [Pseudonocardiales bacterium]
MTTHDEEGRRGGLRGAVDELFGRGESDSRDEHVRDDTVRRDDAYADDSAVDREPGLDREAGTATQSQYGDTQSQYAGDAASDGVERETHYGDEVRGETVTPEQVQRGGDPTAEGQFQHGGAVRGDIDRPGQSRFDDAQDHVTGDATSTSYAHDTQATTTDPAMDTATVEHPAGQPVSTTSDPVSTDAHTAG